MSINIWPGAMRVGEPPGIARCALSIGRGQFFRDLGGLQFWTSFSTDRWEGSVLAPWDHSEHRTVLAWAPCGRGLETVSQRSRGGLPGGGSHDVEQLQEKLLAGRADTLRTEGSQQTEGFHLWCGRAPGLPGPRGTQPPPSLGL